MRAKILVLWLVSFLAGSLVSPLIPNFGVVTLLVGFTLAVISLLLFQNKVFFTIVFGIGVLFISVWHFQVRVAELTTQNERLSVAPMNLVLSVDDLPQNALHGIRVRLKADDPAVVINGYFTADASLKYGDVVEAQTKVKVFTDKNRNTLMNAGVAGESNISKYHVVGHESGWFYQVKNLLLCVRQRFNESIARAFPAAESGLASGIILGEKALISPEMTRMLQASGTTHIIALSGYNVTVILGLFMIMRRRMSRLANLLVPGVFVILFVIMTGAAASLVRAAIMGLMPLLARFLGRESDSFVAILLSAVLMAVVNPLLPLYDVGFQLSFVAIAGVIYLTPIISRILAGFGELFSSTLAETLGAQLATFPLLAFYFGIVSVVAPLTNLIILGLLPACMALVFLVGFTGIIYQPIASLIAVPTYFLLHFINFVISWSGSLAWASTAIKIENPLWILMIYIVIFDTWFLFARVGRTRPTE